MEQFNSAEEYLAHAGVKGMKWGKRKARVKTSRSQRKAENKAMDSTLAPGNSRNRNAYDRAKWGTTAARNINRRMHKGETYESAKKSERNKALGKTAAVAATLLAINKYGPTVVDKIFDGVGNANQAAAAAKGAKAAANIFADSRGLTSYSTIALSQSPEGVWR